MYLRNDWRAAGIFFIFECLLWFLCKLSEILINFLHIIDFIELNFVMRHLIHCFAVVLKNNIMSF